MRFRQTQLTRVASSTVQYINTHAAELPRTSASAAFQELITLANDLRADGATQEGKTRALAGEVAQRSVLVEVLFRDHLKPVVAAAKLQLRNVANLASITLPNSGVSVARIVAGANGIGNAVEPYAAQLIAVGLAPDFLTQLRSAAAAVDRSSLTGRGHFLSRINVTESLHQSEVRATDVIRLLDRLVRSELAGNSPALVEWDSAGRIPSHRSAAVAVVAPIADGAVIAAAPTLVAEEVKPAA